MFLMSLANSLPRRASTTAFLCLVVAHLEWPDMRFPSTSSSRSVGDQVHEQPVHPVVAAPLRVERRREQVPLPDRDDPTGGLTGGHAREDLDPLAHLLDPGCPDEHGMHGVGHALEGDVALERVDLPA